MYDLANQSFTLLIITVLFPIYFREVVVADPQRGDALWSIAVSAALFVVVLLSPILGAVADCKGARKSLLLGTGVVCAGLTMALSLLGTLTAGGTAAAVVAAMTIFIFANIVYQLGENLLASFLPSVSTPRTIGRVSAIGWTMGYVGALGLLIVTLGTMLAFGWTDPVSWRPYFVLAGVWFLLGMIAPALVPREPACDAPPTWHATLAGAAVSRLQETVRNAAHFKQLFRFLLAFLIYGFGVQTMIAFASILASDFGIEGSMLIVFVLQLTITAGATAAITSRFQDRLGAKRTISIFLCVWIVSTLALLAVKVVMPTSPPQWLFWTIGNGIGVGLGGIGTARRTMVGRFSPSRRAGAIGVLAFGQVKAWVGDAASLGLLTGFFVVGLALLMRVNETAGVRAAKRVDRDRERADRVHPAEHPVAD
mgnify:CR=1 FL=1